MTNFNQFKLTDEMLAKPPNEVFKLLEQIGEGAYGSVHRAQHYDTEHILAIKQVSMDTDLQDIIKEITIMQQCDSPHVVKYYGSYFKRPDLWIIMEYCGAGSISDIMRLRQKPLNEIQIANILKQTLLGLEYLHLNRKIHRDVKAGNILLTLHGQAKLADFGVAGQLTDTLNKRNTMIGTPFWMAPEVIQEIGYDCLADIWSLGITAMEMSEGKPPYADIHPMRAIFMIPAKPPPRLKDPDNWSVEFQDFIAKCLVKETETRETATALLKHPFCVSAKDRDVLLELIKETLEIRSKKLAEIESDCSEDYYSSVRIDGGNDNTQLTNVSDSDSAKVGLDNVDSGTMVFNSDDTARSMNSDEYASGTMMINSDTMSVNDNTSEKPYRAPFLDYFENMEGALILNSSLSTVKKNPNNANIQANQVPQVAFKFPHLPPGIDMKNYLRSLSLRDLHEKLASLDPLMDKEVQALRQRYNAKKQPIQAAIDAKKSVATNN